MSVYTPVPVVVAGDWIDEVFINTYWGDNMAAGVPDIFTTKGDLAVGSAADVAGRLGVGSDDQALVADSSQTLGVKWKTLTTPIKSMGVITGYSGGTKAIGTYTLTKTNLGVPTAARGVILGMSVSWAAASNGSYAKLGPTGEMGALNGLLARALVAGYSIEVYGLVFFSGVGETGTIDLIIAGVAAASIYMFRYGYII